MRKRPTTIKGWLEDIATELHRTNELLEAQTRLNLASSGAKVERVRHFPQDDRASAGPFVGRRGR